MVIKIVFIELQCMRKSFNVAIRSTVKQNSRLKLSTIYASSTKSSDKRPSSERPFALSF